MNIVICISMYSCVSPFYEGFSHIYPHLPVYIYPHFWAEAISTSTYLTNIQPSSPLQGGIPFERLCGKMHVYSNLHLFGCVICASCGS